MLRFFRIVQCLRALPLQVCGGSANVEQTHSPFELQNSRQLSTGSQSIMNVFSSRQLTQSAGGFHRFELSIDWFPRPLIFVHRPL